VVQGILGIAAALATPTWEVLYAQHQSKKTPGKDWGVVSGEAKIVSAIAILAGGFIVTQFSFEALFILMGCIQVLATLYQSQILTKRLRKGLLLP
jgi:4-hydroxybenzoate polyprenyltransferase